MTKTTRTTDEVIDDHLALRKSGDLETDIARNYDPAVICFSLTGVRRGPDGVRAMARELTDAMGGGRYEYRKLLTADEFGYLVWDAESDGAVIREGVDSFVVRAGRIVAHTVHYRVKPR